MWSKFSSMFVKVAPILLKSAAVSLGVSLIGSWTYTFAPYVFDFVGMYGVQDDRERLNQILEKTIKSIDKKSRKSQELAEAIRDEDLSVDEMIFKSNKITQLSEAVEALETKKLRTVQLIETNEVKLETLIEKQKENLNVRAETVKKNSLAIQLGLFVGSLAFFYFFGVPINLNDSVEPANTPEKSKS